MVGKSLCPRTSSKDLKILGVAIMKQFLLNVVKDRVLMERGGLRMSPNESIQKYVDKF